MQYKKNATEWEILGDLAHRLHHHDEALEAFNSTLKIRFSPKALKGILKDQEKRRDSRSALLSIIKLTAWQYRWYSEVCFCGVDVCWMDTDRTGGGDSSLQRGCFRNAS